jgi:hypothetical protein
VPVHEVRGGGGHRHRGRLGPQRRPAQGQVEQVGQPEVEDGVDGADDAELGQLVDQVAPALVETCDAAPPDSGIIAEARR